MSSFNSLKQLCIYRLWSYDVAEYGLRNTTCLYSKDVASVYLEKKSK
jgi:hypothetical protein